MASVSSSGGGGIKSQPKGISKGQSPAPKPKMTADPRFKRFVEDKSRASTAVRRVAIPRPAEPMETYVDRRGEGREQVMKQPQPDLKPALPIIRKDDNNPSPSNPFGERTGKTPTTYDRPMPNITPQIRAMAAPGATFVDTDVVTPAYIKDVARQDNDLARRLARNYLDEHSRRMIGGYATEPLDDATVDELSKIGERSTPEDFFKGVGGAVGGLLNLINDATRAPVRVGAYATLQEGFAQQSKTIDPVKVKPSELDNISIANVDLDRLPKYYADQLKSGLSRNIAQEAQAKIPEWLGPLTPDPNPERHKVYQGLVDKVFQQRQDWDYYSDFATPADGVNTLFSAPGVRTAYYQGTPAAKAEPNILGTGTVAGLTTYARVTQMVKSMKDAGVIIDPEDRASMRTGWSADTVNKYAARLADKGANLSDIVLQHGMTWPELKQTLDIMRWPVEEQADIARSLGYKVMDEGEKPIYAEVNSVAGTQYRETGCEFSFKVSDPDMVVTMNDIRDHADIATIDRNQFADMVAMKRTYAALADVKTVPFQDLSAAILLDPTNFGKLQLIWAPLGVAFKAGGKLAKEVGKGMFYSGALMGDVGVGAVKTIGNLIGKAKGVESEIIKPENWRGVTDAAHFLVSESAQSVVNKVSNRAFFVTKTLMQPEYAKDGEGVIRWVSDVLPKLQDAAESGDWSAFAREVPVGAGDYAASGLNSIRHDLIRIAADEDAFARYSDNLSKIFGDEIDKGDLDAIRAMTEGGDYAGITSWLANKHIAHKIYRDIDPQDARRMLDASDLINHVTSAYRSGVNVLTEKSMGIFGQTVPPAAQRINDILSSVSRFWTNAVLTVRPGWNVINKLDNDARLLANGYNPAASASALERQLTEMGVTPTQLREIIYGGNFMDEAVRLNVPVTSQMVEAVQMAKKITVNSTPEQIAEMLKFARLSSDSVMQFPAETRRAMEDVVGQLSVEADKLAKGKGSVQALRDAAAKVENLSNQMFGKTAALDTKLFKTRMETLKEYVNTLKTGDGFLISRMWKNFVELGHAVHRDIEAAARMRVFAPTFIDNYHNALKTLSRDLPQLPNEAQLAERFASVADPQLRDEMVQEAIYNYGMIRDNLTGLVNEAAMHPNKIPDIQAYLQDLSRSSSSSARSFIFSTMPRVEGMIPAADELMRQVAEEMFRQFDGMSHVDMSDIVKVNGTIDDAYRAGKQYLETNLSRAKMADRIDQILQPSTKTPDSVVNWLQDEQVTNLGDIDITVKRMQRMAADVEGINDEFRNSFVELNHEPYLDTLDRVQRQLPGRAHRYDLMRDSFAEKFSGAAKYGDESVEIVGGTLEKSNGVSVILSDGRAVPVDSVQIDDATRAWYLKRYSQWEKAKPSGGNILTRSGIGAETGTGMKIRKPAYVATGEVGMIPPDVARSYTRRMEDDIVKNGGSIPTEYVDADGVKHALAYETSQDFIDRFASGSGLGYYKAQGGGFNLIEGIQRTADNWTYLAKVADVTELDDLADVYINGKRVVDLYPEGSDVTSIKQRIFAEKSAKVTVRYKRDGVQRVLTNDPSRGETLTDATRRLWRDKIEGVYIETRGQWVPVFNPNAPAGQRISFQRLAQDGPLSDLRVPVETGSSIPDEMAEALTKAQDAAEPVASIGREMQASLSRLDNLFNAAQEAPKFKPDFEINGVDVMTTGRNHRLPEGGMGVEVRYADGRVETVPFSGMTPKPVEGTAAEFVKGSPEQVAAEAGQKTAEQMATIQATDPVSEFMRRYPTVKNRQELLDRGALLREHGIPIQDEQLDAMADLLEAASVHAFKQEPDFLLKRVSLTDLAPDSGLYQRAEAMTREGWSTDAERVAYRQQAAESIKGPADEMAKSAEGYPASAGLVGENGEPLFAAGPQGEVLGAFKMMFGKDGPFGVIHFGPGATPDTVAEEFAHQIISFAELPEQFFKGPEMAQLRKEIRRQVDIIADASGAPVLKYVSERGPKATRRVMYQELWKVDRVASNLEDPAKWAKFVDQARAASERSAEMFKNYLKTGKAPTRQLSNVFARFKEWLSGVFQARWNRGENIPVEVKRVFDQWLTDNPEWVFTKRGTNFFKAERQEVFKQAAESAGQLDDWMRAVENLRTAYGDWNDSDAILQFHDTAKKTYNRLKEYLATGNKAKAIDEDAWNALIDERDRVAFLQENLANPNKIKVKNAVTWSYDKDGTSYKDYMDVQLLNTVMAEGLPLEYKPDLWRELGHRYDKYTQAQRAGIDRVLNKYPAGDDAPKYFMQGVKGVETEKVTRDQIIAQYEAELRQRIDALKAQGIDISNDSRAYAEIERALDAMLPAEEMKDTTAEIMQPMWDAYHALLQDGKFHPKQLVGGKWVYPEGAGPLMVEGKLRAGQIKPPRPDQAGYLASVDDILAREKGTPASMDQLAALNAPGSNFVSPAMVDLMRYHSGTNAYLDQWIEAMKAATARGYLPGKVTTLPNADDLNTLQNWLSKQYEQISRAASSAQKAAEDKTRLVMMDFETTYNLDRLMQQGPALPSWAGPLAGARPLRVGGIVPFFKFPRENIESWINTLGNHPALIHNVARYQEQANIERSRFNLPEQFLPTWPVQVGDKVMSVSPFAFISLGQMIRPFSPYIDEDATGVDQAIGVAGQMGFSLGPTMRLALNALGLSQETMPIVPQAQALVAPQAYQYIAEPLQWALGLKSMRDEFYVNRQIVYDALGDLSQVTSETARQQILQDMSNAIQSPDHPRRAAASDHYYTMRFDTSNTGYWTGLYPRETSGGELDMRQYKTDVAQLRAAMESAGLSPDQVDKIESYLQGDPRAEANRRLNLLYQADKSKAISNTETEAWADTVEVAGKRKEYYDQRALIEAEFQQKYGFSGTTMTDADREDYNKRIFALNQKYEDVLAPKKLTKQPWQTTEDYQRNLSAMWLEYLNGTRPQFPQYKTYAEYETAVDQWEKNLPKISRGLWSTIQAPLSSVSTTNISALPGYLDAVSNKQAIDRFRSQYDTVNEAIYSTLRDRYYNGYWDAVTGKVGAERLLAELEYTQRNPVPDNAAIQKWIDSGLYQGRFTRQDVSRELSAHPVADIRNSILSGKTLPERQALEISDLMSRIPPGKAYFNFLDTLPKDVQKYLSAYQTNSYQPLASPTKWAEMYGYLVPALKGKFPEPTISMAREWVSAVHENETMESLRDRKWPGLKSTLDEYNNIDRADQGARKQFRSQHPEIGHYYDWLYTDWQNSHPLWNEYYGNGTQSKPVVSTGAVARPSSTSYVTGPVRKYSTGGKRRYGGGSYSYSSGSSSNKAAQDAWLSFRSMAGPALYDQLISHWDNQTNLGESEMSLLQTLFKQFAFGASTFEDWLDNVLPKMRSAMIPGTSVFERSPSYSMQRQPQFETGYSWFGRGRQAA